MKNEPPTKFDENSYLGLRNRLNSKISALESKLAEAVEVIKFYADINSWENCTDDNGGFTEGKIIEDDLGKMARCDLLQGGKRAREFLAKQESEKREGE
jgi:hypothetical protein